MHGEAPSSVAVGCTLRACRSVPITRETALLESGTLTGCAGRNEPGVSVTGRVNPNLRDS